MISRGASPKKSLEPDNFSSSKSPARSYTEFYKTSSKGESTPESRQVDRPGYSSRPRRDTSEEEKDLRREALRRRLGVPGRKPKKPAFKRG